MLQCSCSHFTWIFYSLEPSCHRSCPHRQSTLPQVSLFLGYQDLGWSMRTRGCQPANPRFSVNKTNSQIEMIRAKRNILSKANISIHGRKCRWIFKFSPTDEFFDTLLLSSLLLSLTLCLGHGVCHRRLSTIQTRKILDVDFPYVINNAMTYRLKVTTPNVCCRVFRFLIFYRESIPFILKIVIIFLRGLFLLQY